MTVRARRYVEAGEVRSDTNGTTGVSILFVPDRTFRLLSDEAAKRQMTVAELLAAAVDVFLSSSREPRAEQKEEPPEPVRTGRPTLRSFR